MTSESRYQHLAERPAAAVLVLCLAIGATSQAAEAAQRSPQAIVTTRALIVARPSIVDFYPEESKSRREEGTARVRICYGTNGRVNEVSVAQSSGFIRLDEAAMRAALQFRFRAGTENGVPMAACSVQPILFSLSSPEMPAATLVEPDRSVSSEELSTLISAVRAETDASKQELAARQLPQFVDGTDIGNIDARTLEDLAALLDTTNDAARRWVAITLGLFERRARFAVPRLMALYHEGYCARLRGEPESDSIEAIRLAIQSIDGWGPPGIGCLLEIQIQKDA